MENYEVIIDGSKKIKLHPGQSYTAKCGCKWSNIENVGIMQVIACCDKHDNI